MFNQFGEGLDALEGESLEFVTGEGDSGFALVFEFSTEGGVVHPTFESGSGDSRGSGSLTDRLSGDDMRQREFLFLSELRGRIFRNVAHLA